MRNAWGMGIVGAVVLMLNTTVFATARTVTVTGTIDDAQATVTVNGARATLSNGNFSANITLNEGHNTITATATDLAGNAASASIDVSLDTVPPVIQISFPTDGQVFSAGS